MAIQYQKSILVRHRKVFENILLQILNFLADFRGV